MCELEDHERELCENLALSAVRTAIDLIRAERSADISVLENEVRHPMIWALENSSIHGMPFELS